MLLKKRAVWIVLFLIFIVLMLPGCSRSAATPEVSDDEILLKIQLDVNEDIGLLVVDFDANGSHGSGGTSNADKSLLKHDDLIYYSLEKRNFDDPSDTKSISLRFTVITEYFTPNFENIYPAEYTKPLDAIDLEADFGESYNITITGDRTKGYTASLEK